MTPADKKAFAEIVIGFSELKGKPLSKPALALYWNAMQHWSLDDFRAAAEQLLRTCEFMPTPKDFEDLRKAGLPTAAEAWEIARKACGSCRELTRAGANYGSGGTCGDPLIDRAVEGIGGYRVIAMSETQGLPFLERRFAEHYETLRDVEDTRAAVPQITDTAPVRARLSGPQSIRALLGKAS